ncbi:hypothetical protein PGT21_022544 [Puccinia graminis f. sp. tritici]|uniref:Uncharacterized protein n=1 Tax=Puccinia graminis f. sp. tritici TaxID=56615 RepID=A0A5B0PUJ7_PUCGR|nr:hypothetical protein PGTUg99_028942 [Puccinia graminis f. sp. tritici]KAA1104412.1 hypothetical protein PGT21_022544 [Puccinia graminis f. sp. tritici]
MPRGKRHRVNSSPSPSVSSTPAQSQEPSRRKKISSRTTGNRDNDLENDQTTDADATTPGGTQNTKIELTDEQELDKARIKHVNQLSSNYSYFDPPELSEHLDKHRRKMIAFPCATPGFTGQHMITLQQTSQNT